MSPQSKRFRDRKPASRRPAKRPIGRPSSRETQAKVTDVAHRGERLQKVMAAAGIGSRRECERLIQDGRVEVDGQVVTELGSRVTLGVHDVRFDGEPLQATDPSYFLVNKPVGVVSTNRDQKGRPRVIDLVPPIGHLFTVGRLDRTSEGLILVTNDGVLANRLAHPRYEIPKVYRVTVAGHPTHEALQQLRRGVWIAEGPVRAARLTVKKRQKKSTILEMVLTEGRNREIRRMAAQIGHKVLELRRIALGPLRLGEVPPGAYRELTHREIQALTAAASGHHRRRKLARGDRRKNPKKPRPFVKTDLTQQTSRTGRKVNSGSGRRGMDAAKKKKPHAQGSKKRAKASRRPGRKPSRSTV